MTTTAQAPRTDETVAPVSSPRGPTSVAWSSFRAVLLRDFAVLDKQLWLFLPRTIVQPLMLVFVLTYVFPNMRRSGVSPSSLFSTLQVTGIVALTIFLQGVQTVALPLVQEFGFTREIDDRVMAPMPLWMVAVEKIAAGALQALLAALIVFPLAAFIPAAPVDLDVDWAVLATILPLACVSSAAAGLTMGTMFEPRSVGLMYSIVLLPFTFLGGVFFSWRALEPIPWLQHLVLVNPLTYISEGMRAGLVAELPHMRLPVIYAVLSVTTAILVALSIRGFKKRVLV